MEANDFYDKALVLLESINKWLTVTSIPKVKEILESTLTTTEAKKIYHYSDGSNQTEIATKAGVSQPTVSNYWKRWAKIGIVHESTKYKGRWEKTFLLEDFGIDFD